MTKMNGLLQTAQSNVLDNQVVAYTKAILTVHTNYYKYHRKFFQLPANGQRTWSNGKTAKKAHNALKELAREKHFKVFNFSCPPRQQEMILAAEYFNRLWYLEWNHEWKSAKKYRKEYLEFNRYRVWKFGIDYTLKKRALTYYKNPYKLKRMKGKKKIKLPKNIFNVGFNMNFTHVYYKKFLKAEVWVIKKKLLL